MVMAVNERDVKQANAAAFPIARFALTQLSAKSKLKLEDFYPYREKSEDKSGPGVRPQTVAVLKDLIRRRALPPRVEAAAIRAVGGLDG